MQVNGVAAVLLSNVGAAGAKATHMRDERGVVNQAAAKLVAAHAGHHGPPVFDAIQGSVIDPALVRKAKDEQREYVTSMRVNDVVPAPRPRRPSSARVGW